MQSSNFPRAANVVSAYGADILFRTLQAKGKCCCANQLLDDKFTGSTPF